MKKLLLIALAVTTSMAGYAQKSRVTFKAQEKKVTLKHADIISAASKTSAVGDTFMVRRYLSNDTLAIYVPDIAAPFDSGLVAGTNAFGDRGFAERFDLNGSDSTIEVLGVAAYFVGSATSNSSKVIQLKAWAQGPAVNVGTKTYFNGYPTTTLDSVAVNIKDLRDASGLVDTFGIWWFNMPSPVVSDSFFVGYTIDYSFSTLNGDTIGVIQTKDGNRHTPVGFISSSNQDTILNVQNATMLSDGTWIDNFWENSPSLRSHYLMAAIFRVNSITGIEGITKNNLTFFGSYPNPATNYSNVKVALKNATKLTVDVMDMTGRKISTQNQSLTAGEHTIPVSTAALPAGNYVYMIRTAEGDAMGIQFTVVK